MVLFFFAPGLGGAGQKKFFWGGAGQGRAVSKILRARQGNSQTCSIFGAGRGSLDNFWGWGSHFSQGRGGVWRGVHPWFNQMCSWSFWLAKLSSCVWWVSLVWLIVQLFFYCIYWYLQSCFLKGSWIATQPWHWQSNPGWQPNPHLFYCGHWPIRKLSTLYLWTFSLQLRGILWFIYKRPHSSSMKKLFLSKFSTFLSTTPAILNIETYLQYVLKSDLNPRPWKIGRFVLLSDWDILMMKNTVFHHPCLPDVSLWSPSPYISIPYLPSYPSPLL